MKFVCGGDMDARSREIVSGAAKTFLDQFGGPLCLPMGAPVHIDRDGDHI